MTTRRLTMSEWKYDRIFEQPQPGIKKQELVTYKIENRKLIKEVVTRRFFGDDDYQDSVRVEVVCDAAE